MAEETKQQRRARERREGAVLGATRPTRHVGEKRSVRVWYIAVGIPTGFVFLGSTLLAMGPAYFTLGACIAYIGIAWLLFDWWFFSRELTLELRLAGTLGTLVIGGIISWVVFRPAPISISFLRITESYADGVDISGIKWSSKYSGFRAVLRNDSNYSYSDIEFLIRTDVMIAAIGFNTKFNNCAAKSTLGAIEISGASIAPNGKNAIPLDLPMADMFKIVCNKLLPHDPVEIILATRRNIVGGGFDAASAVAIRGSFVGFLQSKSLEKSECLIQGCTPTMIP
jgi:hypothetical protein